MWVKFVVRSFVHFFIRAFLYRLLCHMPVTANLLVYCVFLAEFVGDRCAVRHTLSSQQQPWCFCKMYVVLIM